MLFRNLCFNVNSTYVYGHELSDPVLETRQQQEFYLIQIIQTGSGAQRAFYSKGTAALFPRVKASRAQYWSLTFI
jgi:hypothetical protein